MQVHGFLKISYSVRTKLRISLKIFYDVFRFQVKCKCSSTEKVTFLVPIFEKSVSNPYVLNDHPKIYPSIAKMFVRAVQSLPILTCIAPGNIKAVLHKVLVETTQN